VKSSRYLFLLFIVITTSCTKDRPLPAPLLPNEFQKTYGGPANDYGNAISVLPDGSLVIAGSTNSTGNGNYDVYLLKTDKDGNEIWSRTYGGSDEDRAYALLTTGDGGFLLLGTSRSFGPSQDVYLIKVDSSGNVQWQRAYGGPGDDIGTSLVSLPAGGYLIAGLTSSYGAGGMDVYVIKTDASGIEQHFRTYGGTLDDGAMSICMSNDERCMLLAGTNNFGAQNSDLYILELDHNGDTLNSAMIGTSQYEEPHCIIPTFEGNYFIAGHTAGSGDLLHDIHTLKIDPSGSVIWQTQHGHPSGHDGGEHCIAARNGGFVITGRGRNSANSSEDMYVVKTDASGTRQWERHFGGSLGDWGAGVAEGADGYYSVGHTVLPDNTTDVLLVRMSKSGK
jgi:hypothetical protein